MNRRDLLLQQMNITQWVLAKPQVLKGDSQIRLANHIKLVIVSEEERQHSPFFHDLLTTLALTQQDYYWLNFEQAMRLTVEHQPLFLLIQPDEHAVRFTKKFANLTAWHYPSWQTLQQPATKRQFWRQLEPICTHFEDLL